MLAADERGSDADKNKKSATKRRKKHKTIFVVLPLRFLCLFAALRYVYPRLSAFICGQFSLSDFHRRIAEEDPRAADVYVRRAGLCQPRRVAQRDRLTTIERLKQSPTHFVLSLRDREA